MQITKTGDFAYEMEDPVTKGTWVVTSTVPLSDFGVQYSIFGAMTRDGIRPTPDGRVTVEFSFGTESNDNPKPEAQKFLESLML